MNRGIPVLSGLAVLLACGDSAGPEEERQIAVVSFYSDPIVVEAPDSVDRGVPFSVMTRAYGNSCISPGGTETGVSGAVADVTPHVMVYTGPHSCQYILKTVDQYADLTFETSGVVQVRFHGLEMPADSLITVMRDVFVR